jgi:hypothetical protein
MGNEKGIEAARSMACQQDGSRDARFVEMLRAFRRSGGLAREPEVLDRIEACSSPRWRPDGLGGTVVCFEWGRHLWLPWFQFDPADMSLRPGPASVIAELSPLFDGWRMARWFAQPNMWIGDARPIDMIDECMASVLGAARADRLKRRKGGDATTSTNFRRNGNENLLDGIHTPGRHHPPGARFRSASRTDPARDIRHLAEARPASKAPVAARLRTVACACPKPCAPCVTFQPSASSLRLRFVLH